MGQQPRARTGRTASARLRCPAAGRERQKNTHGHAHQEESPMDFRLPGYVHIDELGPFPAMFDNYRWNGFVQPDFPMWSLRHLAAHLATVAAEAPDYTQTFHFTADGRVFFHTPPQVYGEVEGDVIVEEMRPTMPGLYPVGNDWAKQAMSARRVVTSQLRAVFRPRTRFRRFRLAVALHAAATLLQQRLTARPALPAGPRAGRSGPK
jgi:hypothetical protein